MTLESNKTQKIAICIAIIVLGIIVWFSIREALQTYDDSQTTCQGMISPSPTVTEPQQVFTSLSVELYGQTLNIPEYTDKAYVELNGNKPLFKEDEIISEYYESYSGLDDLGRCQVAMACLSRDTMPLPYEKREAIGSVKPAGWKTAKYPGIVDGLYLYNRCHLIGWQLSAENANPLNLTTGTRYLNVEGMLPFENKVDDYIEATEHHVMYRVTPIFLGEELVCRGILIEAQSVEDNGCVFCVYCYNVQPGIDINYADGTSREATTDYSDELIETAEQLGLKEEIRTYIINNKTKKIHKPDCSSVSDIGNANFEQYEGYLSTLLQEGYTLCKKCNPAK